MGKIKLTKYEVWNQIYILPYIKITHSRLLNGDLELIIGWLKWEFSLAI